MEALLEKLGIRLREWRPKTATQVRQVLAEVIELADHDALDLVRSRVAEQEVLDLATFRRKNEGLTPAFSYNICLVSSRLAQGFSLPTSAHTRVGKGPSRQNIGFE